MHRYDNNKKCQDLQEIIVTFPCLSPHSWNHGCDVVISVRGPPFEVAVSLSLEQISRKTSVTLPVKCSTFDQCCNYSNHMDWLAQTQVLESSMLVAMFMSLFVAVKAWSTAVREKPISTRVCTCETATKGSGEMFLNVAMYTMWPCQDGASSTRPCKYGFRRYFWSCSESVGVWHADSFYVKKVPIVWENCTFWVGSFYSQSSKYYYDYLIEGLRASRPQVTIS